MGQGWNNVQQLKNCKLMQRVFFGGKNIKNKKKKNIYIFRQPVGLRCRHWDHCIWTEARAELKAKLPSS